MSWWGGPGGSFGGGSNGGGSSGGGGGSFGGGDTDEVNTDDEHAPSHDPDSDNGGGGAAPPGNGGIFNFGLAPDLFYGHGGTTMVMPRNEQSNTFQSRLISRNPPIIESVVIVRDLSAGLNAATGDFFAMNRRYAAANGADLRHPGHMILGPLTTSATTPDPSGTIIGIHSLNIFNTLMIGIGAGANAALFKETSGSDPTITAVTYSPGSTITGLYPIIIGGATQAKRMAVCRSGGAIDIHSDASATSSGTMHTDTNPAWGLIQTSLPDGRILIYAGNSIFNSLTAASAIGDDPTADLTNVPGGGYALGELQLGGGYSRAWWFIPNQHNTSGALAFGGAVGNETTGRVIWTDLEGKDYGELKFKRFPGGVNSAVIYDNGILATNQGEIVWHDGHREHLIVWRTDRLDGSTDRDSDFAIINRGFVLPRGELFLVGNAIDQTGTAQSLQWWEHFNRDTVAFNPISAYTEVGTGSNRKTVMASGSQPWSDATGFVHAYANGAWHRAFLSEPGLNPYYLRRKTPGDGNGEAYEYAASGKAWSTAWVLPGLEGIPSVVEEIRLLGDVGAAGTGAEVAITVGEQDDNSLSFTNAPTAEFFQQDRDETNFKRFPDNRSYFTKLQIQWEFTQGSDTRMTPNGLPTMVRILSYPDWDIKTPEQARNLSRG